MGEKKGEVGGGGGGGGGLKGGRGCQSCFW